jgi:cell division GTPase FtsZ
MDDRQNTWSVEKQGDVDIELRCIGYGTRGADGLRRLYQSGGVPASAKLWCLDTDSNVVDSVKEFATVSVLSSSGKGPPLAPSEIRKIVGKTASDAGGQGNIGSGDGGLAFILAPSSGIPGGAEALLQLTHALRAAGHFTVAVLVSPFGFEGSSRREQSKSLVSTLKQMAHVVAVLDQDVLLQQSYGGDQMTVAESTEIANAALEHTVRCVLRAVCAEEILKSSQGGLMWHGKDLKHFRRLISPPLQQLFSHDGIGVLGRGLATIPAYSAASMGCTSALMHLSSDAVRAAAESPFVEGVLPKASGVLCCMRVPDEDTLQELGNGDIDEIHKAYKMAAQASAGALRTITGKACDDFVVYIEKFKPQSTAKVNVEVTLLVLWSDGNVVESPSWKASWGDIETNEHESSQAAKIPPNGSKAVPSRSWGMLSAIAGGDQKSDDRKKQQNSVAKKAESQQPSTAARVNVVKPTRAERAKSQMRRENNVTVGDYLAESLTAQSLDLPPAAARWRQEHRAGQLKQRRLVVWEIDEEKPWESEEKPANPLAAFLGDKKQTKKVNVRDRVAGVLAQDRDEAWEAQVRDDMLN